MEPRLFRASALLALALLGASLPARAGDVVQKPEFTITLPAGWVEAPKEAMVPFNANIVQAMPNMPRERVPQYQYGFQPKTAAHWLNSYPYLVVRVKNSGRIPEAEFQQMDKVDLNKELRKHKEQLPNILSKMALNKPLYDPSSHTVWIAGNLVGSDNEPLRALSAMIATKDGFVQLSAYVPADKFAASYASLRGAMTSVVIPPEKRY